MREAVFIFRRQAEHSPRSGSPRLLRNSATTGVYLQRYIVPPNKENTAVRRNIRRAAASARLLRDSATKGATASQLRFQNCPDPTGAMIAG
jgi:hypothetical protein